MARYMPITNPDSTVNVSTTVTQKMRQDLRMLALTKEHVSVKALLHMLIQGYLVNNMEYLQVVAGLQEEPQTTKEPEVSAVGEDFVH